MENDFQISEKNGREVFELICKEQIPGCKINKFSQNEYASWDVSYTFKQGHQTVKAIGEIKVREEYKSTSFTEWFLEKTKLDGMNKVIEKLNNDKIIKTYINFYSDNKYKIFNIDGIENKQEPVTIMLPSTTKGDTRLTPKQMYKCNVNDEIQRGFIIEPDCFKEQTEQEDIDLPF